jgi:predicted nucleotide-binding protein
MKLDRTYTARRASSAAIRAAYQRLIEVSGIDEPQPILGQRSVHLESGNWTFDTDEEFFAEADQGTGITVFDQDIVVESFKDRVGITVYNWGYGTQLVVTAPQRAQISAIVTSFEEELAKSGRDIVAVQAPFKVFIGHGRSSQWRNLKDHLTDQHQIPVEAYEVGARAGHAVRDILQDMLDKSSFACVVLTREDDGPEGESTRARQNVIHELGLFQGRLGFARAIALVEEGTEDFSNISGIHQIRFGAGRIRETFGDVVATIRREFNLR